MGLPKLNEEFISIDEFLRDETGEFEWCEYLGGYLYPLIRNASVDHGRIQRNLYDKIRDHLKAPCEAFTSGVKIRTQNAEGDDYFYIPDVVVDCQGGKGPRGGDYLPSPKFLAEIMSPSTERLDIREKWFAYRFNPAVEEILLLYQDKVGGRIARKAKEKWEIEILENQDGTLRLNSLDLEFPLLDLYERVSWLES